jgi:hypothetical protein
MTPLFQIGDVIRYAAGSTALIKITTVLPGHGGSRAYYCGDQCMGGAACAYHEKVQLASSADLETWNSRAHWRGEAPFPKDGK